MVEKYLIDTSAVIKFLNEIFPAKGLAFLDSVLDNESIISFITEIELQVWNPLNAADLLVYETFVQNSVVISVSQQIIKNTIEIRKTYNLKLPDALIAATAVTYDYILVADNDKDFKKIKLLKYINPMSLI